MSAPDWAYKEFLARLIGVGLVVLFLVLVAVDIYAERYWYP